MYLWVWINDLNATSEKVWYVWHKLEKKFEYIYRPKGTWSQKLAFYNLKRFSASNELKKIV